MHFQATIKTVLFCVIHGILLWITLKIANFMVDLARLSELGGYRLTPDEERFYFYFFSGVMLIMTVLFLLTMYYFLKKWDVRIIVFLFVALFSVSLLGVTVVEIFNFTINGDELYKSV